MLNPHAKLTLARERQKMFLADAEAARQVRQARQRRRSGAAGGTRAVLRDGSEVLIRPVRSTDAALLADGFSRFSPQSRWMRFLGGKNTLTVAELRYLTDVDHHDHEALGALDRAGDRGVGIARYVRHTHDPQAAEIAITIADDWQRRGLGTELLARLSDRARQEGVRRFTALVAASNVPMIGLLRNACADLVRTESSLMEYEIMLEHTVARARERVCC
jgi:RimJ/RimL family protein N-acetyltransferase